MKSTKTSKVLHHLQTEGNITSWEAIELYGATRLSAIIYNLRRKYNIDGVRVSHTDRYGDVANYIKYIYKGVLA